MWGCDIIAVREVRNGKAHVFGKEVKDLPGEWVEGGGTVRARGGHR